MCIIAVFYFYNEFLFACLFINLVKMRKNLTSVLLIIISYLVVFFFSILRNHATNRNWSFELVIPDNECSSLINFIVGKHISHTHAHTHTHTHTHTLTHTHTHTHTHKLNLFVV
jgi:ABC-type nickel/cobalt efflux system permease component RcnA